MQTYIPITYTLECGITLEIDYVPGPLARRKAFAASPEPPKPTRPLEVAPKTFVDEEYEDADWLRAKRAYDRDTFPFALRAALLELGVVSDVVIDTERLEARRKRLGGFGMGDKSDYLMLCLMSGIGAGDELELVCAKILENDLGWAEVSKSGEGVGSQG